MASYVKNVAKKETTILFCRDKDFPEESLITMEVAGLFSEGEKSRVVQVKGNSNRSPTKEEDDFIIAWAKKNEILYKRVSDV